MTEQRTPYHLVELFSGIGAQRMGFELAGVPCETVAVCEIDRFAMASYEAIWGPTPNLGDITRVERLPECDVLTYSFPCTSLSAAAAANPNRPEGMEEGSGTASSLLWEVKRLLLTASEEGTLPRWLVMENVPQIHKGANIPHFERWLGFLRGLGYSSQWADLDAVDFGAPQTRERCFMVSRLGRVCPLLPYPPVDAPHPVLRDVMEDDPDPGTFLTDTALVALPRDKGGDFRFVPSEDPGARMVGILDGYYRFEASNRVYSEDHPAPTVTRSVGGGQTVKVLDRALGRIRRLTPRECWRCQGFPDRAFDAARPITSDTQLYHQAGNTLCPLVFAEIAKVMDAFDRRPAAVPSRRAIEDWRSHGRACKRTELYRARRGVIPMAKKRSCGIVPAEESLVDPEDRIHITYVRVEDLIPYANNPRNNDETVQTLANSMRDFGTKVPPVITRDGVIITGHTRLKAAIALGKQALPCIIADDLDDARAKMFRLADNKIQESSTWDFDKLVPELEDLKDIGFEPEDFNFTPLDLDPFCFDDGDGEDDEGSEGVMLSDEEVKAMVGPQEPAGDARGIRPGDVIVLGGIRLICGSVTLADLLRIEEEHGTDEIREPDPLLCEALARGWAEERGERPKVLRDSQEVDVL